MVNRAIITYIRVSTSQQGRSGLGIEAQRSALDHFAQAEGFEVIREFVEVETGKGADAIDRRPQLKAALAAARKLRCHVAVAKLDRLMPRDNQGETAASIRMRMRRGWPDGARA